MQSDYIMSINQALNYIYQNLDKTLTVEEIAKQCCFSKYHFNRVFKAIVGENIYSFAKRIKLESAAFRLRAAKNRSITEIAIETGYSPSNFASAFKQYFGVSASRYRELNGVPYKDTFAAVVSHIQSLQKDDNIFDALDRKIKIKRLNGTHVVYKRVICNYQRDLKSAWEIFCRDMEHRFGGQLSTFVGISYDDPLIADEERCVYDMCMQVDKTLGVDIRWIEPGMYACYTFYDTLDKLILAFNEIFVLWLPFCKYQLDNRFALEVYKSELDERGKIQLEICIPIQEF